ncbi:MAG: Gfo/Idh/MocA family oxidoreductase [Planctomycetes bacterium]|nr:Gfo/Idh/MocA family oxidoreductase [Planctomycetota bacterium]
MSRPVTHSSDRPASGMPRRRFLGAATAGASALFAAPRLISARSLNEKLNLVVIGCGGRGFGNLNSVKSENIVALCDVNANQINRALEIAPQAKTFRDFRKLYETLPEGSYDAVVVSTTEHTHAFATLPALRRKKHVYCEKPLTLTVHEARKVTEVARQSGVATQMGTQLHASANYRRVVEFVQSGALGPVREVHVWVSRAWGWQSQDDAEKNKDIVWTMDRPTDTSTVPPELDWDLWLGPARARPFHEVYFPGPKWYRWWDFGSGTMSDLGSHWNDLPFWALKLDAPRTIDASGPPPHPEIAPASFSATYEYGPRGDLPPVKLTWHQGALKPKLWTDGKIPQWPNGVLFIGDQGSLLADYSKYQLLVDGKQLPNFAPFQMPAKSIPDSIGHHAEWLQACKSGSPTTCHFDYAGPLTEANHLGSIAYRAGRKLVWDAKNMKFPNAPEAEKMLGREYRTGWSLDA